MKLPLSITPALDELDVMIQESAKPIYSDPQAIMGQGIRLQILVEVRSRVLTAECKALEELARDAEGQAEGDAIPGTEV